MNLWSIRGDQHFGANDLVWGRFAKASDTTGSAGNTFISSNLPNFGAISTGPTKQATIGYIHTFSPVLVNEFRYGFGKADAGFPINTPFPLGPRVQFSDASVDRFGVWEGLPQGRNQRTQQFSDNLSYILNNHTLKFGGEYFRLDAVNQLDSLTRGLYTFSSWADFAAGNIQTYQQRFGDSTRRFKVNNFFAFAQDDWKVNRHLTLNLGVRLEYAGGPVGKKTAASPC
ncbi:MAG: TonB-dependent receptor [Acidobacteriota bacterium]